MKDISKLKESKIHNNPTDKTEIEGEEIKDKINECSPRYMRRIMYNIQKVGKHPFQCIMHDEVEFW